MSASLYNNKMSTEGNEALSPPTRQPNPQQSAASKRLQQTQAQVDEVVGIMRVNVEKVLERDQKLSELDDRAGEMLNELCERINLVSAQLVVDIMRTNVEKVLERDQKLSELDDRADALQQGASQFEQQAGKLKRKFWWKNCKMWAILIGVVLIIIIVIVVASLSG
ncbi:Vesicle-associated membrane protein 3 like protein [Argiope bruennichi]|uniref:Vesicle-associated membrane protein 3 like protein n=1 Tax=Argiope bruennichi TaxID=94029 RepID=A0A8T0G2P9_ARGBR|nr:Vesicle-associated membrane protein 3 like protein [Argiope bruennichi]